MSRTSASTCQTGFAKCLPPCKKRGKWNLTRLPPDGACDVDINKLSGKDLNDFGKLLKRRVWERNYRKNGPKKSNRTRRKQKTPKRLAIEYNV